MRKLIEATMAIWHCQRSADVLYGSEDDAEGALAFAEKRDPVWKGK